MGAEQRREAKQGADRQRAHWAQLERSERQGAQARKRAPADGWPRPVAQGGAAQPLAREAVDSGDGQSDEGGGA